MSDLHFVTSCQGVEANIITKQATDIVTYRLKRPRAGAVKSAVAGYSHVNGVLSEKLNNMSSANDKFDKAPKLSRDTVTLPS